MEDKKKKSPHRTKVLSNAFSSGDGGGAFEARVTAAFVALMVTGGHAPGLPAWPIVEVELQRKLYGYDTDDLIVSVENPANRERSRLICQVKHRVKVQKGHSDFAEAMSAAWRDFNNQELFNEGHDLLALVTGPLTDTDTHVMHWLTTHARYSSNEADFFRRVKEFNFGPGEREERLDVIRYHLSAADGGDIVSDDRLFAFMKSFRMLGLDLNDDDGIVRSLVLSHLSLDGVSVPLLLWGGIVNEVLSRKSVAGAFTLENCPPEFFAHKESQVSRQQPMAVQQQLRPMVSTAIDTELSQALALLFLVGAWTDADEGDKQSVAGVTGRSYEEMRALALRLEAARPDVVRFKQGAWSVLQTDAIWNEVAGYLSDSDVSRWGAVAIAVLSESDPSFELAPDDRLSAAWLGKVLQHSGRLRKGISIALAFASTRSNAMTHCTSASTWVPQRTVSAVFKDADWKRLATLNDVMPILAEAAPEEFISGISAALSKEQSPLVSVFGQEGGSFGGRSYMTGLLWGMEALAWSDEYFPRVCTTLARLASVDPGGQWTNRPINSLVSILLPWYVQTLAPIDRRLLVVDTIAKQNENVAWDLVTKLLPNQTQSSSPTYKPKYRAETPEEVRESGQDYWQQVTHYATLTVELAKARFDRLLALVPLLDDLPPDTFQNALLVLADPNHLNADQRLQLWEALGNFVRRHRKYRDAVWALPEESVSSIEEVAKNFAPVDAVLSLVPMFSGRDHDWFEPGMDFNEQRKILEERRVEAIKTLAGESGLPRVIELAQKSDMAGEVGVALARACPMDAEVLPAMLDTEDGKRLELASGYINGRRVAEGWAWVDSMLEESWSSAQKTRFLLSLPFGREVWSRVSSVLVGEESLYWSVARPIPWADENEMDEAVEKFMAFGRPVAAVVALGHMAYRSKPLPGQLAADALKKMGSTPDPTGKVDGALVSELIKRLQSSDDVAKDDIEAIEWLYMDLLDGYHGRSPVWLCKKLSEDPAFFVDVICLLYRDNRAEADSTIENDEGTKRLASHAYRLLKQWKTVPGSDGDHFDPMVFDAWLAVALNLAGEKGRGDAAGMHIAHVLAHGPEDPDGLWIHSHLAATLDAVDRAGWRSSFISEIFNSRGSFWVDPTGGAEMELAKKYEERAASVEVKGFFNLAQSLRELGASYRAQAQHTKDTHSSDDA